MARKAHVEIRGLDELRKSIKELGKAPGVTPAARKGMTIAYRSARAKAPEDTGDLKKGIILKKERSRRGKAVFQVTMDSSMNDVFVKISKDGKRSYYPAAQEYGYITRDGGYMPGAYFMRDALQQNQSKIEKTIIDSMWKSIDKALR
jgi:HK97 gp10 family phage protein